MKNVLIILLFFFGLGVVNAQTIAVFPVRGKHNTGYDRASDCHPSSWNCDDEHSNSDYIPSGSKRHLGVDIWAALGTPVAATVDGTLTLVGWSDYSGNKVTVRTANGWSHFFCHLNSIAPGMVNGKSVKAGDIIGYVGKTGTEANGTVHLHFSLYQGDYDNAIDPWSKLHAVEHNVCDDGCPSSRSFNSTISSGTYKSSGTVTASAALANGADVVFDAGSTVVLNTGFSASYASGNTFTAKLGGCNANLMAATESFSTVTPEVNDSDVDGLILYPNPASDKVNVSFTLKSPGEVSIRIINDKGALVEEITHQHYEAGNHTVSWDVKAQQPEDVYFCTFESKEENITKRILIQR